MLRTQISLTSEERRLLDAEAARTGRSISWLIRHAVGTVYGHEQPAEQAITLMRQSFGAWAGRERTGAHLVDELRSRLSRDPQ